MSAAKTKSAALGNLSADQLERLAALDPFALEQMAEYGPNYFNPLIGSNPAETLSNISDVVGMLCEGADAFTTDQGEKLVLQCVWVAAQYETLRRVRAEERGLDAS